MEQTIRSPWGVALLARADHNSAPIELCDDLRPESVADCTEAWAAEVIGKTLDGRALYDLSGVWRIWDGRQWRADEGELQRLVVEVVRAMHIFGADVDRFREDKLHKKYYDFLKGLQDSKKIRNIITLLQAQLPRCNITMPTAAFDNKPYALNCRNGILDLLTGELSPHSPAELHTKLVDIDYDPDCDEYPAPWFDFLNTVFQEDAELIEYVRRTVGYSLCASVDEQVFFLCYGSGMNGKSVFFDVLKMLLGDYHHRAEADTFMVTRNKSGSAPTPDLAVLPGKRLITVTEIPDRELNEPLIKGLSAGDEQCVCRKYGHPFNFVPAGKILLMGNERPRIVGQNYGTWRRTRMIPFLATIAPEKRIPREQLLSSLHAILPGILRWAVIGFQQWRADGLGACVAVDAATKDYRDSMDVLGQFLVAMTVPSPSSKVGSADLYAAYEKWTSENGFHAVASNKFAAQLLERKYQKTRLNDGVYWHGFELNRQEEKEESWFQK